MDAMKMRDGLKLNQRWKHIEKLAAGEDSTPISAEELTLLNTMVQLDTQEESRNQARRMVELAEQMSVTADKSAKDARKLAFWTMILAIATFALAFVSTCNLTRKSPPADSPQLRAQTLDLPGLERPR